MRLSGRQPSRTVWSHSNYSAACFQQHRAMLREDQLSTRMHVRLKVHRVAFPHHRTNRKSAVLYLDKGRIGLHGLSGFE
jgi:hypothetical protein